MAAIKSGLGIQAALTAALTLVLLAGPVVAPALPALPLYVSLAGLAMVGVLLASNNLSAYLKIFVSVYGIGYLLFAAAFQARAAGVFGPFKPSAEGEPAPGFAQAALSTIGHLLPPDFAATGAVVFAAIVLAVSYLGPIRAITFIADPYFANRDQPTQEIGPFRWLGRTEGKIGRWLVAILIFINFAQVAMQLRFNFWYRDTFNALQNYDAAEFWFQLLWIFMPLATVSVITGLFEVFVDQSLLLRWRTWLTRNLYERWLEGGTHYRMAFTGEDADNPDQRIQSDIADFVQQTMVMSIKLVSQAATLVSFIVILWSLSRDFVLPIAIPGLGDQIPGFLVFLVIAYAVVGTWLTHILGRPLIGLDFRKERVDANFRFALARNRVYSEQIALMRGERAESVRLWGLFGDVIENYLGIIYRRIKLGTFTLSYDQLSVVFPYILAAPSFFLKKITLGQFQQTADAFSSVQTSLSFFILWYRTLAAYRANTNRLTSFKHAMTKAEALSAVGYGVVAGNDTKGDVSAKGLTLGLPDGREILRADALELPPGKATLLTGPSGSGKSTLFRAIAGIWPFGKGRIDVPKGQSALVLPQMPYLPQGSLRGAVCYPNTTDQFSDEAIRDALVAAQLPDLAQSLDEVDAWDRRLSGGERQRLAIARAILAKPDWLFLDESTAALDETSEARIYRTLREKLPGTTIVSIGHRSTLLAMHDGRFDLQPANDGRFEPKKMPTQAAAE